MKYRKLNEVLIEWNEPSKQDSDNIFLKSEDIEESLKYFVYRLNRKGRIKIYDMDWDKTEKYRDNVWFNREHVELDDEGYTVDEFEPGEYKVYIKGIDKATERDIAFYGCEQLVSAFIPKSTTKIDEVMFFSCTALTHVTIPGWVTSIGKSAFYRCTSLTSLKIPNSVTYIGINAFWNCCSLTSVTIGNSVTSIDEDAFEDCINIKTVYVEDINKFNQIEWGNKWSDPRCYGAQLIELKK